MLIEHIFLGFCGLAAGLAVSAGTFAFLIVIGVIPRMIGKCNRAAETMHFENAVILGGICGNLASVFLQIRIPFGPLLLCAFGISAGIFVGSIAVALAEILNTFPITFRRMGLKADSSGSCLRWRQEKWQDRCTISLEILRHSSTMMGDCSFTEENYGAIHRTPERDYQVQYAEVNSDRKL